MHTHSALGLPDFDSSTNYHQKDGFSPLQLSVPGLHSSSVRKPSSLTHQSSHSLLSPSPNLLQTPVFKVPQDRDSPRPSFGSTEFDPCTSAKTRGPTESSSLWSLVAPSPTTFALSPGLWSSPKLLTPLSATFPKFKAEFGVGENATQGGNSRQTPPQPQHNGDDQLADQHTDSGVGGMNSSYQSGGSMTTSEAQDHINKRQTKPVQRSTSSTQQTSCDTPTLKNIQMKMQQQKEQYRNNMNRNGVVAQSVESVYGNMAQFQQQQGQMRQQQQQGAQQPQQGQMPPNGDQDAQYTQHLARLCAQLTQNQDPQLMNAIAQQGGAFPEPKQADVQFHIKPARKNMDSFVPNTPRDLYSQPYKYDIRIVIPAHIRDHYVLKMQLCVEKTKQYISKNHKNESTLIIERVIEKEHKGEAIFNYRVVFNACSFHFSKSLFSLHLFLIPKVRFNEQQDASSTAQLDTSGYEPVWRSIPFEMYARKVNPRQWPSEQEIQDRVQNYINDQTRSAQSFLGAPFAMQQTLNALQGSGDPSLLSQVVNNAIQNRQQQMHYPPRQMASGTGNGNQQQMHMMNYFQQQDAHKQNFSPPMGESLSDTDCSPNSRKNNKRKRNLQIDTQFSKRQKTGEMQALHM
mmetsp:Transcript_1457/g.4969  ORF Transcript_1457/g.4969 Transcript_1457/m.4969 type:complete len:628 (-) Transcript_1457:1370-3253(-)|eukprot:CAMPEP_0117451216 /NCGR_PEP_ID=MMETSP0759-20121206/8890_1 /TAXON_ID=63605 /ORGANISM="Percolomonas cosmopolitus, Strain WS" /LENGTH=627 /DNA_ID=CAMNT_0005243803 /DNA_START=226 /DNA_END=2109 /DNA_ORIENTATION=+